MERKYCMRGGILTATFVLTAALGGHAEAQTIWTAGIGDWFNPLNWSGGVPNPASASSFDAQINNGGIAQIFSPGASVRRMTLGNLGGQSGGLLLDAGTLNVTENLRLGENGGTGNMTIRNNADVTVGVTILGFSSGSGLMTVSGVGSTLANHTLILGELASGTMVVREGADVSGFHISLANSAAAAFGRITVTGAGSTLVADNTFWAGRTGAGELTVEAGGAVTTPTLDIGSNNSGSGTVLVTGAGSMLTATNTLVVGNNGIGTMTISAGGLVNSIALGLGFASSGSGTVTVTGAGSRLVDTFNSIHVGEAGSGILSIADGGTVTVNSGFGSVVVGATPGGFASTLRIGTGAAPGTLEAGNISLFRANSKLELNHTGTIALGMPISGPGAVHHFGSGTTQLLANNTFSGPLTVSAGQLELSSGGQINNASDSNVAIGAGQIATVRISGAGSKWINTASTFIGSPGTGSVTVENGGELRSDVQLLVNRFATGNGTLTVTGAGSKATTNGEFRIADEGIGLVRIESGGTITSGFADFARQATGNASAIVSGIGSMWAINGDLSVASRGVANLQIENAGKVVNTGGGFMGLATNSSATGVIDGAGSVWDSNFLQVGGAGMANLIVRNGASLVTRLGGSNSVSLGEQAGGFGSVTLNGPETTWANAGGVVVGNHGNGTVMVQSGAIVTSQRAAIAFQTSSISSVTVDGVGSRWDVGAGNFVVGGKFFGDGGGNGTLNVFNGGVVTVGIAPLGPLSGNGLIGFQAGAIGTVNVSGVGSLWNPKHLIEVGGEGTGTMNISAGGRVETDGTFIGTFAGSTGTVTVSGTGSMLVDSLGVDVGREGTGNLTITDGGTVNVMGGTGPVTVGSLSSAGPSTLKIGLGGRPGILQAGSVRLNLATAKLEFNHTGDLAFGAIPITGAGSVSKHGDGTTTLSANSTYSGGTNIEGGTLRVINANGEGLGTGTLNINASSTVPSRVLHFAENANAGSIAVNVFPVPAGPTFGGSVIFTETASAGAGQFTLFGSTSALLFQKAEVLFNNSSTAGAATFTSGGGTASAGRGGETYFFDNASAGSAIFTSNGGAVAGANGALVVFADPGTSAGSARVINLGTSTIDSRGLGNGGTLHFFQGNAASAEITNAAATGANGSPGRTTFSASATGGSAAISNAGASGDGFPGGATEFRGMATAGGATIVNRAATVAGGLGGSLTFDGISAVERASAGSAEIMNHGTGVEGARGGVTTFLGFATAGSARITNDAATSALSAGGFTEFRAMSDAGAATITNGGSPGNLSGEVRFIGEASAANATIVNLPAPGAGGVGGYAAFVGASSAGAATIMNRGGNANGVFGGNTHIFSGATAGGSQIFNQGGTTAGAFGGSTSIFGSASAGSATITSAGGDGLNAGGGKIFLFGGATAASATLIADGGTNGGLGGVIQILDGASGGSASVVANSGGTFEISALDGSGTTLGSIAGSGDFLLGAKRLTVGSNNTSTVVSGSISGSNGGLTKVGTGTLTLSGTNTFTGDTSVEDGRLQVDSALPGEAAVSNGSLAGTGPFNGSVRVGTLFGPGQAFLDPGAKVGVMTVTNTLNFAAFGAYRWELDSNSGQADRIVATAGVSLNFGGSGRLIALDLGASALPFGHAFTILEKQSAGPVSGIFADLPEGAEFDLGANRFRISYVGGNGNDITLTNTGIPEPGTLPLALASGGVLLAWRRRNGGNY